MKYIVKTDDKVVLETESKAKAERTYASFFNRDGRFTGRHESVELVYPPYREEKEDAS